MRLPLPTPATRKTLLSAHHARVTSSVHWKEQMLIFLFEFYALGILLFCNYSLIAQNYFHKLGPEGFRRVLIKTTVEESQNPTPEQAFTSKANSYKEARL